ncbi:hypothetical protein B0A55_08526 [Friedmanniomyces simplex]|uniref:UFSP1/2/DUB catalytic domain-containing protein n=1 Tax=Friedmanniomyces simplex TaxID=329884 RepID=A0A4U0WZH3_9PEZI|nr:hypothetical protein B0A55_08526 [Friedmanniomyces simplex]
MKDHPISPRTAALLATEDDRNTLRNIIPQLAHLLQHSPNLHLALLAHPSIPQISKLNPTEGQWCGYRNLQMLCLALHDCLPSTSPARERLETKPTIPHLQALIEDAWSRGHNPAGREHLGGRIVGTTKFVGTPEAEALLLSLGVPCTGRAFRGPQAWSELLEAVEEYFSASIAVPAAEGEQRKVDGGEVHMTSRPPIFLQRPGHSVTVIGTSRSKTGKRHLLIFDPAWSPPAVLRKAAPLTCEECKGLSAKWTLRQYRKSETYLKKWKAFETLSVDLDP